MFNSLLGKIDSALDKIIDWLVSKRVNSGSGGFGISGRSSFVKNNLGNPPLKYLAIILTQKCNLKCAYCLRNTNSGFNDDLEIPFEELEQIILSAHRAGCQGYGLTGGEFFLYSRWRDLVVLLGTLKKKILIETNGILINCHPEYISYLIKHLGPNLKILISLDSYSPEKHDLHRGKNSFKEAVDAIKLVKFSGIELRANAVLTPQNLMSETDLVEYVKFTKHLGIDYVDIGRVVASGRGKDKRLLLSRQQVNIFFTLLKKYNFFDNYVRCGFFGNKNKCDRLGKEICISAYGIHPCIFHQALKMGDLKDFEKIIWGSFFPSLDLFHRASCAEFQGRGFNCGECVERFPLYLEKIKEIKFTDL